MRLLCVLVCFSMLLQASLSTPVLYSKPKPVDLKYTCMTVADNNDKSSEHDDVPIILLHGLSGNKETWRGVIELLALDTQRKVCAADLRNHGQSPWNDEEYDVVAMTEDVRHLMDTIKASKAIVLGHSLGGRIAVHLSVNYPERVEKFIVEDMRPNGVLEEALKGVQFYARALIHLEKLFPKGKTEKEAKQEVLQIMKEYFAKMNVTFQLEGMLYFVKCPEGKCELSTNSVLFDAVLRNITELLNESSGTFDGPALFIYGAESPFKVGEDESNIKKMFPNAELVGVEGANHLVHTSRKFIKEVIKFINK